MDRLQERDPWWNEFDEYAAAAFPASLGADDLLIACHARRVGLSPAAAVVAVETAHQTAKTMKEAA